MEKRVFRSKIVYWITILFFCIVTLISFTSVIAGFSCNFDLFTFILGLISSIFSLVICISLFEKEKYSVRLINIYFSISIITLLVGILNDHFKYHIYYENQIYYLVSLVLFLICINLFKINQSKIDEINEIGSNNPSL